MPHPSPYVRRRRLAMEIRRLREEHQCSADQLARAVGSNRQQISALENAHLGPDIDLVDAICQHLRAGARRRDDIIAAAADGWASGWWTADAEQMGHRQALYADLESGTSYLAEYAMVLFPGPLQTPSFAEARIRSDPARQPDRFDPAVAVAARLARQRRILAADGPDYDVIIDELAIRRPAADPATVATQLRHLIEVSRATPRLTIRVLPLTASIAGHTAPRCAYSIYRYPDPQDPLVVAVDTVTEDLILANPDHTAVYLALHARLKAAAMPPPSSLALLTEAAHTLDPPEGPHDEPAIQRLAQRQ